MAIDSSDDKTYWGVGIDNDIINASVMALISAVNRYMEATGAKEIRPALFESEWPHKGAGKTKAAALCLH